MTSYRRKELTAIIVSVFFLLAAYICRFPRTSGFLPVTRGWVRCTIQCGLLTLWAISIHRRILQSKVRQYLLFIAALFIFWLLERTVKYTFLSGFTAATRYAWYFYYIPMLLAPLFALFVALHIGKPDTYAPPKLWKLLYIPTFLAILMVMTNDLHQLVFAFSGGVPNMGNSGTYSYGVLYDCIILLIISEIIAFLIITVKQCRLAGRGRRIVLPVIPVLFLIAYSVFYITAQKYVSLILGDMTAVICISVVAIMESCVHVGLIPANTHYAELFLVSGLDAQITDHQYHVILSSNPLMNIAADTMKKTEIAPVMLDGNKRLSGKPIKNAHVMWTEDVSEIAAVICDLRELQENLEGRYIVLQEEYETRRKRQSLVEKNRLYNAMQNQTQDKVAKLSELIQSFEKAQDTEEIQWLTARIAVIAAYLKRRNNLIFIAEENSSIPIAELRYCLKESISNLRLCGAECNMNVYPMQDLRFQAIMDLYDAFETAVEFVMDTVKELFVTVSMQDDTPTLCLNIVCDMDLSCLLQHGFHVVREDENEWTIEYSLKIGGEA